MDLTRAQISTSIRGYYARRAKHVEQIGITKPKTTIISDESACNTNVLDMQRIQGFFPTVCNGLQTLWYFSDNHLCHLNGVEACFCDHDGFPGSVFLAARGVFNRIILEVWQSFVSISSWVARMPPSHRISDSNKTLTMIWKCCLVMPPMSTKCYRHSNRYSGR